MTVVNFIIAIVTIIFSSGLSIAVFNAIVGRNGRRASEAQSISDVAASVNVMNQDMRKEMRELKEAVIQLTDTIDQILDEWSNEGDSRVSPSQKNRIRIANNRAKIAS